MFFAYLVQEFLQFLFTHYFLFLSGLVLSIIYRLFNLNLLELRDSSSSYNKPLQKEQIQCFQKLIMDRWTSGFSPLQENAEKPIFRGPPRPERSSQTVYYYFEFIRERQNKCTLLLLFPSESMMNDYLGFFSSMRNGFVTLKWKPVDR